tara:strand:- start:587 stop:865 length:279 start_codon:yes stop_codon:yes gene_type:complete
MPLSDNELPDPFSKTQKKKEMIALQKLGERLVTLSESQLAKLPLSDEMLELVQYAKGLKTHESIRRHAQYIGKKMRGVDAEAIQKAMKKIDK